MDKERTDLPQEIDDYIKESIQYTLGLPVSTSTLEVKLRASEEAQRRLRESYLNLNSRFKEKDLIVERAKAEANMNALALKKFIEENQKLASECAHLLGQCEKWERECSLYDHDREALMDFGNEADQRAKDAEARLEELQEVIRGLSDELHYYKRQYEACQVDSSLRGESKEEDLLESVLATTTLIGEDESAASRAFLEANSNSNESCQRLLEMWNYLKPSTRKVLALAAELKAHEKDKEHLRVNLCRAEEEVNLCRAEEEVKLLFEENNLLDAENKKLLMKYHKEKSHHGSSGKHTNSASVKSNKRKCSTKMCSPIEKKIDFSDGGVDTARQPLSPLRCNSPRILE